MPATASRLALAILSLTTLLAWSVVEAKEAPERPKAPAADQPANSLGAARSDDEVIKSIDARIKQGWTDADISPSQRATDGEWCRRVYLDVLGRIPSLDEITAFLKDRDRDKRAKLVDRLLTNDDTEDRYLEQYARNWATIWSNLLIGRTGGMDNRSLIDREGMQQYLRRSFERNKPYDRFVFELVSADGVNKPGEEDYNGAVNYLVEKLDEDGVQATAHVSRLFLGVQVQCTQCHNHPFNTGKQDQFWGMNAFFRQTRSLRTREGRNVVSVRLADQDYAGSSGDPKDATVSYELRNGVLVAVRPTFINGTEINPSGILAEVNRREELARLITSSDELPRAIVNRTWGHFLGYGFTRPVDDMGPHNRVSHPELLDELAVDFKASQFDLKRLIRWIVLSEPYALSSRAGKSNEKDDPALGNPPLFSRFYLRQMRAEELYESLLVATKADETSQKDQDAMKRQWLGQFSIAFGTDDGEEATTFNGTIPQALMMMNSDLVQRATACEPGSMLHDVVQSQLPDKEKINRLYLAALARPATGPEMKLANELWQARKGDSLSATQDIWWVLLNTNEFILNH